MEETRESRTHPLYVWRTGRETSVSKRVSSNRCDMDWHSHGVEAGRGNLGLVNPAQDERGAEYFEQLGKEGVVPLRKVRALTGRLSWMCGSITRARWCVNIFYAVIAQTMSEANLEPERARKRDDPRPKPHMVAVHRMEIPRLWFLAMLEKPEKFALPKEPLHPVLPTFALVTDAAPMGVGAILADIDRANRRLVPLEALEIPITQEIASWMGIEWQAASGQGPLEAWAVLMGLKKWKHWLRGCSILIRSDSVKKQAAPSPVLNWIGAELALRAEELQLGQFVAQHIPGAWNQEG